MRLWLHSGGTFRDSGEEVKAFLEGETRVVFVPYALDDLDTYLAKAREIMGSWGFDVTSTHQVADPKAAVREAPALFVGGGNTFRLATRMVELDLFDVIRRRVAEGMPYLGSSAGSNMACPTIMTTNDMPIVYPQSFDALGLVPFQINPHYLDPDPDSTHRGETREQRLMEYHEMNELPVVGLREGSSLWRVDDTLELRGTVGARLFRRGQQPTEYVPGDRLDFLLDGAA